MVPEDLVRRWELAYQQYSAVMRVAGSAVPGDPATTRGMVMASQQVAEAWRDMERVPDLPWWIHAALVAAAQAFEFQARDWDVRPVHTGPGNPGVWSRPLMRLSIQPRRSREGGGSDE